jgi:hypothetical protein
MNRTILFSSLLAAAAVTGVAPAQEVFPSTALRIESLFAPQAAVSPAIDPSLPASALFGAPATGTEAAPELLNYYVELRAGPMFFANDLAKLSPGLDAEVAVGFYPSKVLAVELTSGVIWGESGEGTIDRAYAIPIVANAKVALPLGPLEAYGGAGIGAYFVRVEVGTETLEACDCDWVIGGNVFVGANIDVGPVMIGAEAKYILTASAPAGNGRASLEGLAVLLGVGIRF